MEKLVIIRTNEEFKKLFDYIQDKDYIAYDTESAGLGAKDAIIGFSVCADIEVGYYVILRYWDVEQQKLVDLETLELVRDFLKLLVPKNLIMQNAPHDCAITNGNFEVELMPSVHTDTLILGHLLNENRSNGLKERGVELYGEDARKEQDEMKASVTKNGGVLTKKKYELYKGDADLIAKYGAKDAILTLKVFYNDVEDLYAQELDKFFYEDESMPLLRGPTYDLNTAGLRVDVEALAKLKSSLEAECIDDRAFIYKAIKPYIKDKYPGTSKAKTFNLGAPQQLSWLLFTRLGNEFYRLTDSGKELCEALNIRVPYTKAAKREFIETVTANKDRIWRQPRLNRKTKKMSNPAKVGNPWQYMACGKLSLGKYSEKYPWIVRFLEYAKKKKLLNTYVIGIQSRMQYNIIRPSFLQHGTTSGRYASRSPNFQNLPRDDKRIKACIVSRPGKVFVGADYAQLEPRVFAAQSQCKALMECFKKGEDFYSVAGASVFDKQGYSLIKSDKNSFANTFPKLREDSKVFTLSAFYGRTVREMAQNMKRSEEECQQLIDKYFATYPEVECRMLELHEEVKSTGVVRSLFGRPRRIPAAMEIVETYGNQPHSELPYAARNLLNLAVNHPVQGTAACIANRASIAFKARCEELSKSNILWLDVKLVVQTHDELVAEGPKEIANEIAAELKDAMENTTKLPGVALVAEPKIGYNLADLK